jgi:hypothetical protein
MGDNESLFATKLATLAYCLGFISNVCTNADSCNFSCQEIDFSNESNLNNTVCSISTSRFRGTSAAAAIGACL